MHREVDACEPRSLYVPACYGISFSRESEERNRTEQTALWPDILIKAIPF